MVCSTAGEVVPTSGFVALELEAAMMASAAPVNCEGEFGVLDILSYPSVVFGLRFELQSAFER